MPAHKRNPAQRDIQRAEMLLMRQSGMSLEQIGDHFGVVKSQVHYDLQQLDQAVQERSVVSAAAKKALIEEVLTTATLMALRDYAASHDDKTVETAKRRSGANGGTEETTLRREKRIGDPRWVAEIRCNLELLAKLNQLLAPDQNVNLSFTLANFSQMIEAREGGASVIDVATAYRDVFGEDPPEETDGEAD